MQRERFLSKSLHGMQQPRKIPTEQSAQAYLCRRRGCSEQLDRDGEGGGELDGLVHFGGAALPREAEAHQVQHQHAGQGLHPGREARNGLRTGGGLRVLKLLEQLEQANTRSDSTSTAIHKQRMQHAECPYLDFEQLGGCHFGLALGSIPVQCLRCRKLL